MLALLGNLANANSYEVAERIVRAIDQQPTSVSEKYKRINQLRIIVQLRKFESQFEIAMSKAATFFKKERDPFYKMGAEEERAKAEAKDYNVVANLLQQLGLDDAAAAGVAEVPLNFVRKVRADLAKNKK